MLALVVDDSRTIRTVLKGMLERLGFQVVVAAHGAEALIRVGQHGPPALILADWNMPYVNGLDLVKALRSDHAYDGTRLLMVSSETESERVAEVLAAGADEYAMKPFTADVIAAKLEVLGLLGPSGP